MTIRLPRFGQGEVAKRDPAEVKLGLGEATIGALAFLTVVCLLSQPFALLMLFVCVLSMLLEPGRSQAPKIQGDADLYRRLVRPVGRCLVWAPVAALIVLILMLIISVIVQLGPMVVAPISFTVAVLIYNARRLRDISRKEKLDPQLQAVECLEQDRI